MTEIILTHNDMTLLLHIVEQEIKKLTVINCIPEGSDLLKLYEKLLDICELEDDY